jgi:glucose-1-phosphate thymidylyltransferase
VISWRRRKDSASRTETFGDFPRAKRSPKPFYDCGGQGCRIISVYDKIIVEIAENMRLSACGELEITEVNKEYLNRGSLKVELLGRGMAWLDTGAHESHLEASNFIATIEHRKGLKVAYLEPNAYNKKYITKDQLLYLAQPLTRNQ